MNDQRAFSAIDPEFPEPQRPLNQVELARITSADPATINRLIADGRLDLRADWRDQLAQFYRYYSETAAGRRGNGPLDLVQERARQAKSIADKNEFELRKARGEYAPKDLVCRVLSMSASTVRTHLLSLPSRIKSRVPETPTRTFITMEEEVHITLTNLATHRLPPELAQAFAEWEAEGKEPRHEPRKKEQKRSRRSATTTSRKKKDRGKNQKVEKKTRKDARPGRPSKLNAQSVQAAAPAIQEKGARPEVSE
jgi:phage terminase Nu1 subunit (DNA packaging protein)